ncbi:unnamed protein product [Brassicogethes aeneus]|uniref:Diphthine--ammonia ligase n=1 Tax=Brassicogethes aeneus TaxID=1431903 RepID=A0A9P0BDL6_BRAAE|nr:unnamed protein product [Brassicogethes aeneus]
MKVVALISGGKDSTFNMMQCIAAGHQIVCLANLVPHSKTEIDSYMYQSVGHEAIDLIAAAMDLPLYKKETMGVANDQGKNYKPSKNDEVEDLYLLLKEVMEEMEVEAVSVGAILSDYQRIRVENVCVRLNLVPLAYLWQQKQADLFNEMIKCEVDAIVIKVAALGLEPNKHLGRSLSSLQPHLFAMNEKYGLNVCGEGGEYETLTLDCPLFKSRIVIDESEIVMHTNDTIAPVGYLVFKKLSLSLKTPILDLSSRLDGLPLKNCDDYVGDEAEEDLEYSEKKIDEEEDDAVDGVDNHSVAKSHIEQKPISAQSADGWLWIGGIQGKSSDPSEAMQEAMNSLKSVLELYGHNTKDICSICMYIGDMSQYLDLNKYYVETFNHSNPPTRACVEVPFDKRCPLQIEALSWSQNGSGDPPIERCTMHVQSRSHWAPANIGPYSQAVRVGDIIKLAGQIGLIPGSLELIKGGIRAQCKLTLRHIGRLLKAVDNNVNLRDVVQGICYLTDVAYVEPARKIWESKTNNAIVNYVVVTGLPKNAFVEWWVWAHKHNNQFEYEERGKRIENFSISIYRRWNYENNIAALVCLVENQDDTEEVSKTVFVETLSYVIEKLQQGHENDEKSVYDLKVFYPGMCTASFSMGDTGVMDLEESWSSSSANASFTLP